MGVWQKEIADQAVNVLDHVASDEVPDRLLRVVGQMKDQGEASGAACGARMSVTRNRCSNPSVVSPWIPASRAGWMPPTMLVERFSMKVSPLLTRSTEYGPPFQDCSQKARSADAPFPLL